MGFPFLLIAIRERGLFQWRLAAEAGLSEAQVSRIIRRGQATAAERAKLSSFLQIPEQRLFSTKLSEPLDQPSDAAGGVAAGTSDGIG
jgi:hypothetical protein